MWLLGICQNVGTFLSIPPYKSRMTQLHEVTFHIWACREAILLDFSAGFRGDIYFFVFFISFVWRFVMNCRVDSSRSGVQSSGSRL